MAKPESWLESYRELVARVEKQSDGKETNQPDPA